MFKNIKSIIHTIKTYGVGSCFFNYFSILISDVCVVSFQKSGRTWLRMMLAKVLALKYNTEKIRLDTQFMTLFKPEQNVLFSHAGCTQNNDRLDYRKIFKNKKIIFLVRDPKDEIVSLYHDHTKRNFWYKGHISNFIRDPKWGLKKVIAFMNLWAEEMNRRQKDFLLIKYEDMKKDTHKELKKILNFLRIEADDKIINKAVEYGSFKNMRIMELNREFKDWRMQSGDIKDPNSYRTRKGKIGSYKEELNKKDIEYLKKEIKEKLNPIFKY